MKKFLAIALIGALASCGTVLKNPLQPSLVYNLENAYGVAQASAITYTKLPRCSTIQPIICSKAIAVVELASYDKKAKIALGALQSFVRNPQNYPGLTYASLLSAAQQAISAFQTIETTNGVN